MTSRRRFPKNVMRETLRRSEGRCEATGILYGLPSGQRCNADLSKGVQYDHVVRFADGGESDLTNCAAVCIKCHAHKTAKVDTPGAAKTKRMSDKARGIKDPPKMQSRPMTTTPKAAKRKTDAASKIPVPPARSIYRSET